ncbi:MAG: AAA+ family ATPase [Pseudorhodobacter sp.]|nr:AAA+ family ATPase [Pseudorhodobacter sp.]
MKQFLAPIILCLSLTPVWGQDAAPKAPNAPSEDLHEGFDLMQEGTRLLLRGMLSQMEPALDDMGKALIEMQPAIRNLLLMIGDIRNYHAPVMLPNGDIIIRRRTPAELAVPEGGEIEL